MQQVHQADEQGCRMGGRFRGWMIGAAAVVMLLCGTAQATDAPVSEGQPVLPSAVSMIETGQWDRAATLLQSQPDAGGAEVSAIRAILEQYGQMQQQRRQKQQAVLDEHTKALDELFERYAAGDPNTTSQAIFKQAHQVWCNASEPQRKELTGRSSFQSLLQQSYREALELCRGGQWGQARSQYAGWLVMFDSHNAEYRALDEKLADMHAIAALLKKDPCDATLERYAPVQGETIGQVFGILQTQYVTPVNYSVLVKEGINRCLLLADVMRDANGQFLYTADPNQCDAWKNAVTNLAADFDKPSAGDLDARDFFGMQDVVLMINRQTLKLPDGVLLTLMTEAALSQLDDYTRMIWPAAVAEFDKQMTGQFGGAGFRVSQDDGVITIDSLIPNTPASRSALKPTARIVAIDGESTKGLEIACAVKKISGPVGTSVTLTVTYPDSDQEQLITLVRDKIVLPTVEGSKQASNGKTEGHWDYFLSTEEKIGYLRLSNFTGETMHQVTGALTKLEAAQMAGLILDLRGNGGGLLTSATELTDLFVDDGLLLESRGRSEHISRWNATNEKTPHAYPVVILMDGGSASASEIVAGVLGRQGYHRAVLVGERSFGKGSVQEVVDLGATKGRLKFTAAYYYLPNGEPVANRDLLAREGRDDWGIVPDVQVPLYDFEKQRIKEVNSARRDITANDEAKEASDKPCVTEQMIEADPQLATGLLVLKARIAADSASKACPKG